VGARVSRERPPSAVGSAQYSLDGEQVAEVKGRQQALREDKMRLATDDEINELWKRCGLKEIP
jgi:hypothetical protein